MTEFYEARLNDPGGRNMSIHRGYFNPTIEWERYKFTLPKSKAQVEIIREIIMTDADLDFMDLSKPN